MSWPNTATAKRRSEPGPAATEAEDLIVYLRRRRRSFHPQAEPASASRIAVHGSGTPVRPSSNSSITSADESG